MIPGRTIAAPAGAASTAASSVRSPGERILQAQDGPAQDERQRDQRHVRVALHRVPRNVADGIEAEPVPRIEGARVLPGIEARLLGERAIRVRPVGVEASQPLPRLPGVRPHEPDVGKRQEEHERQAGQHGAPIPPVERGIGGAEEQGRQDDDRLERVVAVEGQGAEDGRGVESPRLPVAVSQVEVQKPDVGRGREHELERDPRVQEEARKAREREHPDPVEAEP